jgi:molybdopterin-guanine dinucleotide biosynthesis protein A
MGRPKAWLPVGGEAMLRRVVRILREAVEPVVVVASPGQDVPRLPRGVEVVRDAAEGRGPLQGLAAGLAALEGKADAAFACGCDFPMMKPAFVRRLIELLGPHAACAPELAGRPQPLAGVYRVSVLEPVRAMLAADLRSLHGLLAVVQAHVVPARELIDVDPALDSLRNVNTPEDYESLLRDLGPPG